MSEQVAMYAEFVEIKLRVLVEHARELASVMNEDLTPDGVTTLNLLDWLALCGLTLTRSEENEAFLAYRMLLDDHTHRDVS